VQHSSPAAQQWLRFALGLAETQHACGGEQHSSSAAQQSTFALVSVAVARPKQHACGGLQHSAFTAQQSSRAAD
jgi:hypothetical protein